MRAKTGVGDRAHGIGEEDFFGEADGKTRQPVHKAWHGVHAVAHLIGNEAVSHNGPCH